MRVYALVGPSGSGKSHKATMLASDMGISFIIDDGLLIGGGRVYAGKSAKAEVTKLASVKRALFTQEEHRKDVAKSIKINKIDSILILGTSGRMVHSIANSIEVGEIEKIIYINEISTEEEIKTAQTQRQTQGKHVIPVPTFEIKKDFGGYLLDPLYIFRKKGKNNYVRESSKTIIRPTFSFLGKYTISNNTLYQISNYVAQSVDGFEGIERFRVEKLENGIIMNISVTINYDYSIMEVMKELQAIIYKTLEKTTAIQIASLNITTKHIVINNEIYP